jgi:regulator of protease activity HflC (stomatin/prohibitin superfamily)
MKETTTMSDRIIAGTVIGGAAAFALLIGVFGGIYSVDQGERAVVLRMGAITGVAQPGLGFKVPFVDSVIRISVQQRAQVYRDLAAYSRDQQPATLIVSVSYRLPEGRVAEIYQDFGGEEGVVSRLIDRQLNEAVRTVFGRYNAVEAVQRREQLAMDVRQAVQNAVQGPVEITGVQVENIDFSDAYEASIEQRMLAEVEVQRVQQNAERERVQAEIHVIQARAAAEAQVADAEARATATRLQGDAEAAAIRVRGEALRDNPALIELVQAERWNGVLPTTMLPGSAVPFLSLPEAR